MKRILVLIMSVFSIGGVFAQQDYKEMIKDNSINFYKVCKVADAYFETVNKDAKGSGYKQYLRWVRANEYKYAPSGRRDNIDTYFVENEFRAFKRIMSGSRSIVTGNKWIELGPQKITTMGSNASAGVGRVEDFYISSENPNKMYLSSRSGGFWKTNDGGVNWEGGFTDTLIATGMNTFTVSPFNEDKILANIRSAASGYSQGIYQSMDGGEHWQVTALTPHDIGKDLIVNKIAYHPLVDDWVYVCTNVGLYYSQDGLQSKYWTLVDSNENISDIAFHPIRSHIVYMLNKGDSGDVRNNYVSRSINYGISFDKKIEIANNNGRVGKLSISKSYPNCVFFASNGGVWKSENRGFSYSLLSVPPIKYDTTDGIITSSYVQCDGFTVNDMDTANILFGAMDVWIRDWEFDSNPIDVMSVSSFEKVTKWWYETGDNPFAPFNPGSNYVHADLKTAKCINGVFYVGTDGFLCKSEDRGLTWEILSQGVGIRENYELGVSQSNHFRTVTGAQDAGSCIWSGDSWLAHSGGDGFFALIHPLNSEWVITTPNKGRTLTQDGGKTKVEGGISPENRSSTWDTPILNDPNQQMRLYDFTDSIFVSEDFGHNWVYRGKPTFSGDVTHAAIAENNSNIIVVVHEAEIELSVDAGRSFVNIKPGHYRHIFNVSFDPNNDSTIVIVYSNYGTENKKVFITHDLGANWINITSNLGNLPIHCVVIDHTEASNIYVGSEIGVYTKPMNGTNWTLINNGLPNVSIMDLEIVRGTNTLRAATWGRGLWETKLVNRAAYPEIISTSITDQPTLEFPKAGNPQNVGCAIKYPNYIQSVYVEWSVNNSSIKNKIQMTRDMYDDFWFSDSPLPNYGAENRIYFKVFAIGDPTRTKSGEPLYDYKNNGKPVVISDTSETYRFMYTIYGSGKGSTKQDYKALKLYPNPTKNRVQVELKEGMKISDLGVYSMLGKNVTSNVKIRNKGGNNIVLDLRNLPKGMYLIKTKTTSNRVVKI